MNCIGNAICTRWRFLFSLLALSGILGANPDLTMVNLHVQPDFKTQTIEASCSQTWKTSGRDSFISLNLYPQLQILSIRLDNQPCNWKRDSVLIRVALEGRNAGFHTLTIVYQGKPIAAPNAPWDGGFVWSTDPDGKPWLTVACQDKGAALWWPAPESYSDHPDSAIISCTYPAKLFFKGNGRLLEDRMLNARQRYTSWRSSYPINTYNLSLNIADYGLIRDTLMRRDGSLLSLEYYPLKRNVALAAKQFQQVKPMIDCYERNFGPYPYQRDGFSIVEVPYAGMEHQGAIAYGNGYVNGYLGSDYSGIGLDFDFILIHESGHQWWGNSVTAANATDEWIHEAFCTYAEYVYVNCRYGTKIARDYINAKKRLVKNQAAILGNADSGIDMYTKGALMLYTLEQLIGQGVWQELLLEFSRNFAYTALDTRQLIQWFSEKSGRNLNGFFRQYLERPDIPVLEYQIVRSDSGNESDLIRYRVANAVDGFQLPVGLVSGQLPAGKLIATANWQEASIPSSGVVPDETASYFSAVYLKN